MTVPAIPGATTIDTNDKEHLLERVTPQALGGWTHGARVVAVIGAAVLVGCGESGAGGEASDCSEASSTGCCEAENLVWVYDRITDADSYSYPTTIFGFHQGSETALTSDDAASAPSVSPDGDRIVFQRGSEGDPESAGYTRFRLYVMNSDGTNEDLLLAASDQPESTTSATAWDTHPVWSPDGSRIAFLRNTGLGPPGDEPDDVHRVMVVSADGGEPRPLPGSVTDMHGLGPAWSADSTRLTWITGVFPSATLYWASLDGADLNEVHLGGEPTGPPTWVEADDAIVVPVGDRLRRIDTASGAQSELDVPVALRAIWTLPTGQLAGLDGTEERSRIVVMDVDELHDLQEITTIKGSRTLPSGSVGARSHAVTAVPAMPGGWGSCRVGQPSD